MKPINALSDNKQISIILPSFRDRRILSAIKSIRMFDDLSTVRIIVIDGGSDEQLIGDVRLALNPDDVLVSERDKGIFDALNKGLDRVNTPYVGWLGSDDLFTGEVRASEVVSALHICQIYVASLYITSRMRIRRLTRSYFSANGLIRFGLHNPHYSTFGHADLFCAYRFDIASISADIGYFLDVFSNSPSVRSTPKVATLQEEGGFSTGSSMRSVAINRSAYEHYRKRSNGLVALLSVALKMGHKMTSRLIYSIFPRYWDHKYPSLVPLVMPLNNDRVQT